MKPAELYRLYCEELHRLVNSSLPPPAFRQAVVSLTRRLEANISRLDLLDRKMLRDEFDKEIKDECSRASGQRYRWALVMLLKAIDQPSTLLEHITTPVCGFGCVGHHVRQRHLDQVIRIAGGLCRPIPETRSETVRREVAALHASQHHEQRHVESGRPSRAPGNT
jgi:hypothetical protein